MKTAINRVLAVWTMALTLGWVGFAAANATARQVTDIRFEGNRVTQPRRTPGLPMVRVSWEKR